MGCNSMKLLASRKVSFLLFILLFIIMQFSVGFAKNNQISNGWSQTLPIAIKAENQSQEALVNITALAKGNNEFAFDLYHALDDRDGNLFFSPFSISSALAMVYAGARNNTEKQMAEVLHFDLPQGELHPSFSSLFSRLREVGAPDTGVDLNIANSLWGQKGYEFVPEFLELLDTNFGSTLRQVDFIDDRRREKTRKTINRWVSEHTNTRITELLQPGILSATTRLVLVNAIYFKAAWRNPFLDGTEDALFTLIDGKEIEVPTMSRESRVRYVEKPNYQALEISYKSNSTPTSQNTKPTVGLAQPLSKDEAFNLYSSVAMIVILPNAGQFEHIEDTLDNNLFADIEKSFFIRNTKLYVPKFEFEQKFKLKSVLASLGMSDVFQSKADLSGLSEREIAIQEVIHQANITVNEKGAKAAAATAVPAGPVGYSPPIQIRINRPFIFFICDRETGSILFLGRVMNPLE